MAELDPARIAERLLDLLPGVDLPRAVELIEADRAAVREQALREAIATIEATPIGAWRKSALDRLEKLLTGGKTHG